jgi:hypothetical protein
MRDAFQWLADEAASGGGLMLPIHLTPYIMGLPYRISALEGLLGWLAAQPGCWFAPGGEILDCWEGQQ